MGTLQHADGTTSYSPDQFLLVDRPFKESHGGLFEITWHQHEQGHKRGISIENIRKVLQYGRITFARGAKRFFVGRKEVASSSKHGIDLRDVKNLHVLVDPFDNTIITSYKNERVDA
jgi:hypothetical protein